MVERSGTQWNASLPVGSGGDLRLPAACPAGIRQNIFLTRDYSGLVKITRNLQETAERREPGVGSRESGVGRKAEGVKRRRTFDRRQLRERRRRRGISLSLGAG